MLATFFILLGFVEAIAARGADSTLSRYNITDMTVSGISSGGYMAVQIHVAFSQVINGSAIFAAGPYYCAEGSVFKAEYACMATTAGVPDVSKVIRITEEAAAVGNIDSTTFMRNDRIYLFSGAADTVVDTEVIEALQSYYKYFVDPSNIVADYSVDAQHCMPTLDYGERCATLSSPYIGDCDFDGAGMAFETLSPVILNPRTTAKPENLIAFSQLPYIPSSKASLGDVGYLYVPDTCQDGTTPCSLHIAFHGCHQDIGSIGNEFAAHAGYNEWAESNHIIVLYPYAKKSVSFPTNPNACWDWWGYTNGQYSIKSGMQMKFVRDMITDIAGW